MLRKASQLIGFPVRATDGDIGSISKIYFDDDRWTVRYVVVDTGKWLPGRKVLISPISIGQESWTGDALSVSLTREQVKSSPPIDTARPVSRQHEMSYYAYYGYPYYWGGAGFWGGGMYPWALAQTQATDQRRWRMRIAARSNRSKRRIRTCATRALSSGTTSRPRTVRSDTWTTSCSTTGPGAFDT